MNSFYIDLNGFSRHEIASASKKAFRFTELICEEPNIYGFLLVIQIERESPAKKGEPFTNEVIKLSTRAHEIFSSKKTHFSFEPHRFIFVPPESRLYVQLHPVVNLKEFRSRLLCVVE
jgi:hypothetical protein